jgi:hypothetical protein
VGRADILLEVTDKTGLNPILSVELETELVKGRLRCRVWEVAKEITGWRSGTVHLTVHVLLGLEGFCCLEWETLLGSLVLVGLPELHDCKPVWHCWVVSNC